MKSCYFFRHFINLKGGFVPFFFFFLVFMYTCEEITLRKELEFNYNFKSRVTSSPKLISKKISLQDICHSQQLI